MQLELRGWAPHLNPIVEVGEKAARLPMGGEAGSAALARQTVNSILALPGSSPFPLGEDKVEGNPLGHLHC